MTTAVVCELRRQPRHGDIRVERPLSADAAAIRKRADAIRLLRYERQHGLPHFPADSRPA